MTEKAYIAQGLTKFVYSVHIHGNRFQRESKMGEMRKDRAWGSSSAIAVIRRCADKFR
jgi:hypothetical protein